MELVRMVVGVITITDRANLTRVLTVERNLAERHFRGLWFLPGCIVPPGEHVKSELELLTDEFSNEFGVQFGLEARGKAFSHEFCGINYLILALKGNLSAEHFILESTKYDHFDWYRPSSLVIFSATHIMARCFKQFGLI